jgi:hypothetical protein
MDGAEAEEHFKQFQAVDPHAASIVSSSESVVTYVFHNLHGTASPVYVFRGPVYIIGRRVAPWYQLIVKGKNSKNNLIDYLHPGSRLDCQKNYIFYKVEGRTERSRRLWFRDDAERIKLEGEIEAFAKESQLPQWLARCIAACGNHHNAGSPSVEKTAETVEKAELVLREDPKYN